jgi:cell wall-associated protease
MTFKQSVAFLTLLFFGLQLTAQSAKAPESWFTLDPTANNVNGTGGDEALKRLKAKGKKGQTVIVAVLDSGVDYMHEDLREVMWVNPGEIAGNGKDDDENGYIDDIHGWNFLGGKDGRNVDGDSYELTREYARLNKRFQGTDPKKLYGDAKKEYEYYQGVKEAYDEKRQEAEQAVKEVTDVYDPIEKAFETVGKAIGKKNFGAQELSKINPGPNKELAKAVTLLKPVMEKGYDYDAIVKSREADLKEASKDLDISFNPDFNPRDIVGDKYEDLNERYYGNNDYKGPESSHGTHVAGTIAAKRDNGVGMNGVADNVRIMSVRCVPDGDERDKDVANAIRYAVDNGASIINMSFGKDYSPHKAQVDEAVKYAAEHDVLIVHAAGNDASNNDVVGNFPNDGFEKPVKRFLKKQTEAPNWLEIGALSWKKDESRVASFSNYGKKGVDLFAPGVQLYSTYPDNRYNAISGTSMASPAAAGVAAILRSYYPDLSAVQIKKIMTESVIKQTGDVKKPGTTEKVAFSELCVSGGIVSAPNAVELAEKTKAKKSKKAAWREAGAGKIVKINGKEIKVIEPKA